GRKDVRIDKVVGRRFVADLPVGLIGNERAIRNAVDRRTLGDVVAPEISLRKDVVVLQRLELDVLAATPVSRVEEGQQTEDAAVDSAGITCRAADAKVRCADQALGLAEQFWFGITF